MTLHLGDCREVLKTLSDKSIDLIYLDPPFLTQKIHCLSTRNGEKRYSFDDLWESHSEYVGFLMDRIREMHRLLKDTGSLFFHCNDQSSHLARFVLDELFGEKMFRSEIIWAYRRWSNSHKGLLPAHQTILFYSKTMAFTFNQLSTDYSASTNVDQILQKRERDHRGKSVYARDPKGVVIASGPKKGVPLSDVWEIPYLNPKAKERVGYPTQKPVLLLDRILSICSNPQDVVLDPFCGSGTTLVAAKMKGRRGIGIDCSKDAIELTRRRLADPIATRSRLLERGRENYVREDVQLLELLKGIEFHAVQRNRGVDAILKDEYRGRSVLIRIQRDGEPLDDAVKLLRKAGTGKGRPLLVLIATDPLFQQNTYGNEIVVIQSTTLALKTALESAILHDTSALPLFQRLA
ncbi:MAG: modification methylase [Acidobacteriaceae bacterium]|nr:modification methylase [Acidobacteriaceae bacterium]